ncbi:hypothetical protein QV09_07210 [Gallibacterium salpingitidis]|uniref:Uncharacterized protein n=2 Tax=Gallibacterium salpingitidis TaxID=505341 RepID=A0AB36E1V3_9PAST|nr:hypothetical protein QV09_07210 [Gallibacterium salpingitidis]
MILLDNSFKVVDDGYTMKLRTKSLTLDGSSSDNPYVAVTSKNDGLTYYILKDQYDSYQGGVNNAITNVYKLNQEGKLVSADATPSMNNYTVQQEKDVSNPTVKDITDGIKFTGDGYIDIVYDGTYTDAEKTGGKTVPVLKFTAGQAVKEALAEMQNHGFSAATIKYKVNAGDTSSVTLGQGFDFRGEGVSGSPDNKNIVISKSASADDGVVNFTLSKDLKAIDSIGSGDSKGAIGEARLTFNSATQSGEQTTPANITANNVKLTGLADGKIEKGSKDAITGGQLADKLGINSSEHGTINDRISQLEKGLKGTVVYTDAAGNRVVKTDDGKYYHYSDVKDSYYYNGKWYSSANWNSAEDKPTNESESKSVNALADADANKVILSLVDNDGDDDTNTTTPITLGNLASALGINPLGATADTAKGEKVALDKKALDKDKAQSVIGNSDATSDTEKGIYALKGIDLTRAATVGDLQALAFAGLDILGNQDDDVLKANRIRKTLGSVLNIEGKDGAKYIKSSGNDDTSKLYSADNLITHNDEGTLRIEMLKAPTFEALNLQGSATDAPKVTLTPGGTAATPTMTLSAPKPDTASNETVPVQLKGIAAGADDNDAVNMSQLNAIKTALNGKDGTPGTTGTEGPAGQDGTNGQSIGNKVQALRDGLAGTVVYTAKDGKRLVVSDDGQYFYRDTITTGYKKANNGKWYSAVNVDNDGNLKPNVTEDGLDLAGLNTKYQRDHEGAGSQVVNSDDVILSTVNTDGTTTKPITLANLAGALGVDLTADTTSTLEPQPLKRTATPTSADAQAIVKNLLEGKAGKGTKPAQGDDTRPDLDMSRVATAADLQVLAQAGLVFQGNDATKVNRALSQKLSIAGYTDDATKFTALDNDKAAANNIFIEGTQDTDKGTGSLTVKLAKDLVSIGSIGSGATKGADKEARITFTAGAAADKDGTTVNEMQPTISMNNARVTGVTAGVNGTDALNVSQLTNLLGTGYSTDKDGKITTPAVVNDSGNGNKGGIGGTGAKTIEEAISALRTTTQTGISGKLNFKAESFSGNDTNSVTIAKALTETLEITSNDETAKTKADDTGVEYKGANINVSNQGGKLNIALKQVKNKAAIDTGDTGLVTGDVLKDYIGEVATFNYKVNNDATAKTTTHKQGFTFKSGNTNLTVTGGDNDGVITYTLADQLTGITSIEGKAGAGEKAAKITFNAGKATDSADTKDIDERQPTISMGSARVTDVLAGVNGTDAVNKAQLDAIAKQIIGTPLNGKDGKDGINGIDGYGVDGNDGYDGTNGVSGAQGQAGAPGAQGQPGRDGVNGLDGSASNDGTNGTTIINKVQALRDGAAGTVVYTDLQGNRVLVENGKFYSLATAGNKVKAADGLWYDTNDVDANGVPLQDKTGKTLAQLVADKNGKELADNEIMLSTVNPDGSTKAPATLANIASALGIDASKYASTALTADTVAKDSKKISELIGTTDGTASGLYALKGAALDKAVTLADLQALGVTGLVFADNTGTTLRRALGTTLNIVGKVDATSGAAVDVSEKADDYSGDNLATVVNADNKQLRIQMLKTPGFDGIVINGKDGAKGQDGKDGTRDQDAYIGVNDKGEVVVINGTDGKDGKDGLDGANGSKVITEKDLNGDNTSDATIKLAYATDGTGYTVDEDGKQTTKQAGTVKLGEGLHFNNGTNITAQIDKDGIVKYNLNDVLNNIKSIGGGTASNPADPKEARITFTNGVTDDVTTTPYDERKPSISMNGARITDVADGVNGKDAVNKGQLDAIAKQIIGTPLKGADGKDGINGVDGYGYNGTNGVPGAQGIPGVPGQDGLVGPAGKDGTNGTTIINKVQALRDGAAGTVVYTDKAGNRVLVENGKYYSADTVTGYQKADNGLWYSTENMKDGKPLPGAEGLTLADLAKKKDASFDPAGEEGNVAKSDVMLSAVNPDGSTTATTTLANIASALGIDSIKSGTNDPLMLGGNAITDEAAKKLMNGYTDDSKVNHDGLLNLKGAALNKATTLADLQAVAQAGLDFLGNQAEADGLIHRPLGSLLKIQGNSSVTWATSNAANYSADNLITHKDGKDGDVLRIEMKKTPGFDGIVLNGKNGQTGKDGYIGVDGSGNVVVINGTNGKDGTTPTPTGDNKVVTKGDLTGDSATVKLAYKANGAGYTYTDDKEQSQTVSKPEVSLDTGLDFQNGDNTTATVDKDGKVTISVNKDLTDMNSATFTKKEGTTPEDTKTSTTKIDGDGITITATGKNKVSLTKDGLDNGGNTIKNVAGPENDTDAANKKYVDDSVNTVKGDVTNVKNDVNNIAGQLGNLPLAYIKTVKEDGKDVVKRLVAAEDGNLYFADSKGKADKDKGVQTPDGIMLVQPDQKQGMGDAQTLGNVADGKIAENSKEAVNGGQLHSLVGKGAVKDGKVTDIGGTGKDNIHEAVEVVNNKADNAVKTADEAKTAAQAARTKVKGGKNIVVDEPTKDSDGATVYTVNMADNVEFKQVTIGGNVTINSTVDQNQDGSTTNVLNVGTEKNPTRVRGVADGVNDTDAVNMRQIRAFATDTNKAINNVNKRIDSLTKESRGGIAGAMATANLQQTTQAGRTTVSVGTATFKGESAVAFGISKLSDNGKIGVRLSGMTTSSGDTGGAVSVGYTW